MKLLLWKELVEAYREDPDKKIAKVMNCNWCQVEKGETKGY